MTLKPEDGDAGDDANGRGASGADSRAEGSPERQVPRASKGSASVRAQQTSAPPPVQQTSAPPPISGNANVTLDDSTLEATGSATGAPALTNVVRSGHVVSSTDVNIVGRSDSADLTLLQRRAAWLGRGADGAPYISFHSLFAALLCSSDAASQWAQSKLDWTGFSRDGFFARWRSSAPDVVDLGAERLTAAAELAPDELPDVLTAQISPSAQALLGRADELRAELGDQGPVTPLHLLAADIFSPPSEHVEDLAQWSLVTEAWATRLVAWQVEAAPQHAEAWRALLDARSPRPASANLILALRYATGLMAARAPGATSLDARALLEGLVAAGRADTERKGSASQLVAHLGKDALDGLALGDAAPAPTPLPLGPELWAIFARARVLATATVPPPGSPAADKGPELGTRHVIAALLLDRRPLAAFARLRKARRTQRGLLAQFRRWLQTAEPGHDSRERWRRLFEEHRADLLAGYHNDESHGEDRLAISADVAALAQVIASTKVTPPLSVGLFGDWGSGKSFFMRKLREQIDELQRAAKLAGDRETSFCGRAGHVVQIDFNAWHYMDADLWSSLAVRVFDALSETLAREDRDRFAKACLAHLSSVEEREAQLGEERRRLAEQEEALRRELVLREAGRKTRQLSLTEYAKPLAELVLERVDKDPTAKALLTTLRIPLSVARIQALLVKSDVENVLRRAPAWYSVFGSWRSLMALLGVFAAAVLGGWAIDALRTYAATVAKLVGALNLIYATGYAIVRTSVALRTKDLDAAVDKVQEIEGKLRAEKSTAEKLAEAELAEHTARIAEIERERLALAQRKAELEAELARLERGDARTLRQLILERASADDYRRNLGVISAIHRDFRELSQLLNPREREARVRRAKARTAQREALHQEIATSRGALSAAAPAPPSDAAPPPAVASGPDAAPPAVAPSAADPELEVERIILYIDDLDRCPPKRVVEVLQAIHIILSLPLFVVVVAVDSRWLLDSLKKFYLEQFPAEIAPAEAARPQQYLEKIFQVPYTLWPMTDRGYRSLVGGMLGAGDDADELDEVAPERAATAAAPAAATPAPGAARTTGQRAAVLAEPRPSWAPAEVAAAKGEGEGTRPIDLLPASLELEPAEVKHLRSEALANLLPSPRTAKRLVNLYRIVRAGLDDDDLSLLISGWYKHVQVCLAIVLGHPTLAKEMFERLLSDKDPAKVTSWLTGRISPTNNNATLPGARDLKVLRAMKAMLESDEVKSDLDRFRDTVRRAARFSFETGRLLGMYPEDD